MGKHNSHDNDLPGALNNWADVITRYCIVFQGTVVEVDEVKFTCSIKSLESTFMDVPLRVLKSAQAAVVEIPALNTSVIACFRNKNMQLPQVLFVQEVSKLLIKAPKTIFNGGQLGGMVKAGELKTQSNKDKEVLDALLNILNGPPINEPGSGAPSALQAALKAALTNKHPGTWNDLENSAITQ